MFGLPSLHILIILATIPVLIGLAMVNYKETWYNVAGFFFLCINSWFAITSYMTFMYKTWSEDNPTQPTRDNVIDERPTQADPNLIPRPGYGQSVVRLKIDCVVLFNRTLLDQRRGNLEINMTENFWIKKTAGAELSNWQKIGGIGKPDWDNMIKRGIVFGAYKEIGGQRKRVPSDWQKIRRLERGEPLPR